MSFDHRFDARWNTVLRPGIELVPLNGERLEPHRIDLTMAGDSVLTGILEKISRCRIIVADISALGTHDGRPVRNENVFYEVALAHAVRLPEEVVLFRSDLDPLAFDISNVRVHQYDPDSDPVAARAMVTNVVSGSLNELELRRHLAIRRAAESLTRESFVVLSDSQTAEGMLHPQYQTAGTALAVGAMLDAIGRLLDLTAIRAEFLRLTPEMLAPTAGTEEFVRYRTTPFGTALLDHMFEIMGIKDAYRRAHQPDVHEG